MKVDLEATKAASAGFDVSYDKAGHTVTFKATTATLATYNADRTKEVATLFPTVVAEYSMMAQLILIISP